MVFSFPVFKENLIKVDGAVSDVVQRRLDRLGYSVQELQTPELWESDIVSFALRAYLDFCSREVELVSIGEDCGGKSVVAKGDTFAILE